MFFRSCGLASKMASPAESAAAEEAASVNGAAAAEVVVDLDGEENFQGPHKWRQHLRHVNVPKNVSGDSPSDTTDPEIISDRKLSVVSEEDQTHDGRISNRTETDQKIPPWKQEYLEKKRTPQAGKLASTGTSQIPVSTLMRRRSQHLSGAESAFTRQVVNSGANARKKISPSNSFRQANQSASSSSAGRRTPSQGDAPSTYLTQKRIERVQRARLYLLQQTGPNSFLIGGDSPDHKFRVIIGPQTCSCGRGPHCVHVLFVMLRVFQVRESDARLWSKTLKNFEVEGLFNTYHEKRSSRLTRRRQEKAKENSAPEEGREPVAASLEEASTPSENDTGSTREEEDTCPICLLEMLEGESLIKCENSCHNRLHHHCIAIWFEECRRQNDPLSCPLCRTPWTSSTTEIKTSTHSESSDLPEAPPNTRSSSPQPTREESDGRLPHAEQVAQEFQSVAAPWIEALGEDLVNCLFSRNWSFREAGLKYLSKEIIATLLRSAGEGRSGAIVSPTRQAATHAMLETSSKILAHMCGDPVYRVFVACLRSVRTLLAYTPCRDQHQRQRLQKLLKPIINAIFLKCTDGNRRTSQLSLSTLLELAKGQSGELAVGREIVNPGTGGLEGLDFVVRCATEEYDLNTIQWQWLLGRLYVLDKLMEEFPNEFLPRQEVPDSAGAAEETSATPEEAGAAAGETPRQEPQPPIVNYDRLMSVAHFAVKAVCSSHMRIARMSRRVFLLSGKLGSHIDTVIEQLEELLNGISASSSVMSLKRKLQRIVADFQLSEKIVHELQHGCERLAGGRFESSTSTPLDSPASTPRCNSPNPLVSEDPSEAGKGGGEKPVPSAPPNTPTHRKNRKLRRHSARRSFRDCPVVSAPPTSPEETQQSPGGEKEEAGGDSVSAARAEGEGAVGNVVAHAPPRPPRTLACPTPVIRVHLASTSDNPAGSIPHTEDLKLNLEMDEGVRSISQVGASEEQVMILDRGEIKTPPSAVLSQQQSPRRKCCCACHDRERGLYDDAASQTSGTAAVPNSPKIYHTAEQESMSSDDYLDLNTPSSSTNEKPVSFKSEVAQSPKSSPSHTLSSGASGNGDCPCKEEVEKEEAEALAKAMEVSEHQSPTPVVPGLTPTAREEVITIRIQPDDAACGTSIRSGDSSGPQMYYEGIHWVKGPLLGTGAFSTCYQARDARTGVIMAVKQISFCRNSSKEQESVVEAITAEIHMMSRLSHPNVVRILGATKQGCHFNMFVEWMSGGSLSYLLGQYGAFTEQVTIRYTRQILRGLAYLHDNHILHRDLKGANLLVDSTGQLLRIGDFGASARLASKDTTAGEFQGQLLGTIAFMAPEVLRGESYGRACDVWSVGCVIIEMSTCRPPWNSHDISNHLALIFKIASSQNPPPIPDNLSPPLRDLMLRCLEQTPKNRPPAKELLTHPLFTRYPNS